jgi:hypothetical protein
MITFIKINLFNMKNILVTLSILFFSNIILAQTAIGFNIGGMQPYGIFAKNLNGKKPGGLSLNFTRALPKNNNLSIGGFVGATMYGYREYNVQAINRIDNTPNTIKVYEDDCILQGGVQMRYSYQTANVLMPYANANISWNGFFSHIDPMTNTTNYPTQFKWQGHSLAAGIGFGTRINLFKLLWPNYTRKVFQLDINKSYMIGTPVSYRNFNTIEAPIEDLNYGKHYSETGYGVLTIGTVFVF